MMRTVRGNAKFVNHEHAGGSAPATELFRRRELRVVGAETVQRFALMTDGVLLYYKRFFPSRKLEDAKAAVFRSDFNRHYRRRWYIPPFVLLGTVAGCGMTATAETIKIWTERSASQSAYALEPVAASAFLGGMLWVTSDQLTRFRGRDFTSHDVYNGVFRLLIAILLGAVVAVLSNPSISVRVAFLLGAFPTATLFTIIRRLGSKQLGLAEDAVTNQSELENLQRFAAQSDIGIAGLTGWLIERRAFAQKTQHPQNPVTCFALNPKIFLTPIFQTT